MFMYGLFISNLIKQQGKFYPGFLTRLIQDKPEQYTKNSRSFLVNRNSSQYLRVISGLLFVLFFSDMAQAVFFQRMIQKLPNVPQPKVVKIFSVLDELNLKPEDLSAHEVRALVRALDDPTYLIKISPDESVGSSLTGNLFPGRINAKLFFSLFNLHQNSDALFAKLFSIKNGNKYQELPFKEAKRNWEDFLDALRVANKSGNTQFTKTDLEAAAISFIHQRFPDKYPPNTDLPLRTNTIRSWTRSWEEESLGVFFHNQFNINHYISPYFTLISENHYYKLIMKMTQNSSFLRQGKNLSLRDSKEFVLRIWNDVAEEIRTGRINGESSSAFLELIVNSSIEFRRSSSKSHPFLKALEKASRENNHLVQLMDIVDDFIDNSGNLRDYKEHILRQFIEASGLDEDVVYNLLSHYGLL